MVDHYSVLGVAADASAQEIQSAYRRLQKDYHPDRYAHLAPEMRARAEQKSQIVNESYAVLSDPEKRNEHDHKMAEWDGPVSSDGIPIIVIGQASIERYLLMDDERYASAIADQERMANEIAGYDESVYEIVKEAVDEGVDTPRTRRAWRDVLARRHQYLAFREACWWDRIGGRDHITDDTPEGYAQLTEGNLESLRERQKGQLAAALLPLAQQRLLPAAKDAPDVPAQDVVALTLQTADRRFDEAAAQILQLAHEREEIAQHRLDAVEPVYHNCSQIRSELVIVRLLFGDTQTRPNAFRLSGGSVAQVAESALDLPEGVGLDTLDVDDDEQMQLLEQHGVGVISYRHAEGIDIQEELSALLTAYYEPLLD
jgi:curved DNA-binding protein CbpA